MGANRDPLCSEYYSNATLASLISITALTIVAYALTAVVIYYLVIMKNLLVDVNVVFLKNQAANNLHIDRSSLFNYSFLNWLVIIMLVSLVFIKWGRVYGSIYSLERLVDVVIFSLFFYTFFATIGSY